MTLSNRENRYNIIMTFQIAKTDITYPPHAARIIWVLPRSLRTAAQRKALAL
jgi:hypothetical protein